MGALVSIIVVVCAVGISAIIGRFVRVPLPLVQIALGALGALPVFGVSIALDPELFLVVFVAPLLFADAWGTSKRELFRNRRTIVTLAFGLALFTVAGAGFFVHWLIPGITLPIAFALASVLSPTDAVAVQAITKTAPLPHRLMNVIEGEALLNDATGLVALRFSVATALTGLFSPAHALFDLTVTAVGGLALGIVFGALVVLVVQQLTQPGDQTGLLLLLIVPIAAFQGAEHLHLSGVLAAVGAGIAGEIVARRYAVDFTNRLTTESVWGTISFALNGAIFVILGMQLPSILGNAKAVADSLGVRHPLFLVVYVVAITAALILLRFGWTLVAIGLTFFRQQRLHMAIPPKRMIANIHWAAVFAGVRGAITLGAVLTLPMTLNDGTPFPARDTAILFAAGVILVSLITSSIALPIVAKNLEAFVDTQDPNVSEEENTRIQLAHVALSAVEARVRTMTSNSNETEIVLLTEASSSVMAAYKRIVDGATGDGAAAEQARLVWHYNHELRLTSIVARREALRQMVKAGDIDDGLYRRLLREIDFAEASEVLRAPVKVH